MSALLEVEGLIASYGSSQVLFGVSFSLEEGMAATLLGRNGMGKTTTIKCITGLLKPSGGRVLFDGKSHVFDRPHIIGRAGIALVPEGRRIFPNLTVRENLTAFAANRRADSDPWTLDRVLELFPKLAERLNNMGSALSGGEQQMLAIGRALMTNPRLLILDEATEGLAPLVRAEIWLVLARLRRTGLTILVIDKYVDRLMEIAGQHTILELGRVVWTGSSVELAADRERRDRYLGV